MTSAKKSTSRSAGKKSSKKATGKNPPPRRRLPDFRIEGGTEVNPEPGITLPDNPPHPSKVAKATDDDQTPSQE